MTKIDVFSGFLGAGKTTLIKKLIKEAYAGEKLVLIENEFGEIGIDGGFLAEAGIKINEMNSGCICCSLVGDFSRALHQVMEEYAPDRILIEPSGVGKLSDIIRAVQSANLPDTVLNAFTTVVDVSKCKVYMKNFGEFYNDQVKNAACIVLSHTDKASETKVSDCLALLRTVNTDATIVTTPWSQISGTDILAAMEKRDTLEAEIARLAEEQEHSHHHEDGEECCCGHHHDEDEDECCCGHDHDGHHHHHEDGEECSCGCGEHHHHHHADEVFTSVGFETAKKYTHDEIAAICAKFDEDDSCGMILRAKGIVPCVDGTWIHFDYVPGECDVRTGSAGVIGRLCVIGSKINKEAIAELLGV